MNKYNLLDQRQKDLQAVLKVIEVNLDTRDLTINLDEPFIPVGFYALQDDNSELCVYDRLTYPDGYKKYNAYLDIVSSRAVNPVSGSWINSTEKAGQNNFELIDKNEFINEPITLAMGVDVKANSTAYVKVLILKGKDY